MTFDVTQQVTAVVTLQDRFTGPMGRISGSAKRLPAIMGIAGHGLRNSFRSIETGLVRVGAATAIGLGAVIKAAADYEDAFATVRKTIDPLDADLDELEKRFVTMSKRIPVTAVELAEIGKVAGQLGIRGTQNIEDFVEVIAKLSRVTDLQVGYASEQLGKLGAIFQLNGAGYKAVGNSLVALGNSAASSEAEILDITRRFAAAGKAAGLAIPDILALASTVASLGLLPEAAGSALSRLFNNMSKSMATSDKKARELAKVLGLPFETLQKQFAGDPLKVFEDLFNILGGLYKSGKEADRLKAGRILKLVGINNVRDLQVVQQLSQNMAELNRQQEVARKGFVGTAGGALDIAAEKRFASFKSQWTMFKNTVVATMIILGKQLFPPLIRFFERLGMWLTMNEGKIEEFGRELAKGIDQFFDNFTPETFDKISGAILTGVDAVKGLVDSFLGMPEWIRNILVGGWAANKFTGGALGDAIALGMKSGFEQFFARGSSPANPVWVAGAGLGGPGGVPTGGGASMLTWLKFGLGTVISSGALALLLKDVWDSNVMPKLNEEAGQNILDVEAIIRRGNRQEILDAITSLQQMPNKLDPLQRVLYDLNASGVKVHTEGLITALTEALKREPPLGPYLPGQEPTTNKPPGPVYGPYLPGQLETQTQRASLTFARGMRVGDIVNNLDTQRSVLKDVKASAVSILTQLTNTKTDLRTAITGTTNAIRNKPWTFSTTVNVNVDGRTVSRTTYVRSSYGTQTQVVRTGTGGSAIL